jgi:hypothetical protein
MNASKSLRVLLLIGLIAVGGLELGKRLGIPHLGSFAAIVKADVGRSLSPVSVSGVARRTARRN